MAQIEMDFTHHHNSTELEGSELEACEGKAKKLDDRVFDIFKANPTKSMAWFEVMQYLPSNTCEGSVKRALTNNKDLHRLERTTERVHGGPYNATCFRYKLIV